MGTAISVTVRPHWVNGWFLRLLAVPVVLVDGTEHPARWSRPVEVAVRPGERVVGAGVRYRGTRRLLGYRPTSVDVRPGARLRLLARNGPLNGEPFSVRLLPCGRPTTEH